MKNPDQFFLGLMSGTSMDGIDAAVVRFADHKCEVLFARCIGYPDSIRRALKSVRTDPASCTIDMLGQLDRSVGECFADAANTILAEGRIRQASIVAIGSHGQTLRHQPNATPPFTLQIGDPNVIAARTGIAVVADFRRFDMAVGGQGAPLAPAFHQWLFADPDRSRAVVNIGGIANVTLMPPCGPVTGFDTGPGNILLDAWIRKNQQLDFDAGGNWAKQGSVSVAFLDELMRDSYFNAVSPKSTGFEYFNLAWLECKLAEHDSRLAATDVQASIAELTAWSIADAISRHVVGTPEVFVCGGGVHNRDLMSRLADQLGAGVESTAAYGLDPDWVEAAAFAWLARQRLAGEPGNVPTVTGASKTTLLGGIYAANP
jgi:anhydro-N-acetylmuramic acid kinase